MINFDTTQINKDTKVIVFQIDFSSIDIESSNLLDSHLKKIHDELGSVGVKALFIDDSIEVTPLTDEMMSTNKLKSF